ncbi:MAG: ChbG/HpnK family deacetylase [Oscillospiraceae bacterium]|nr:ChbG/HpnK family deacetylase [Oscillospiraceae bacterium]
MSKYLIINADDFGYNQQQNSAITELLEKGLITSTSLLAVAPEAKAAAEYSKEKCVDVGVHLTINSDDKIRKWQSLSQASSFEGGLPSDHKDLIFKTKRKDVREELENQYRFITDNGGTVDHADNHCGTLYGINGRRFFVDAFDFCAEHKLPYRFPKTSGFIERQIGRNVPGILKKYQQMIVRSGEKRGVKMLDDLVSNPWPMKRIGDYDTLEKYYLDAVDNCIDGVTEIFMHPALPLAGDQGEWQKRVFEYQILKSGCLLERAKQKGITVVSWSFLK